MTAIVYDETINPSFYHEARTEQEMTAPRDWTRERSTTSGEPRCLLEHLRFEWHGRKTAANRAKHEVTCEEAKRVFSDPLGRITDDHATLRAMTAALDSASQTGAACSW